MDTSAHLNEPTLTVGYLGPPGTFTEEALLAHVELSGFEPVPMGTFEEVLDATVHHRTDRGFVAIENSIEGTVNVTIDSLVFGTDLLIQSEVVLDVHLHLMALAGTELAEVKRVISFPHASAQCRGFLARELPGAEVIAANSTAEAAAYLGREKPVNTAALAPILSARLYGLEVLASAVEDHPDNQTRFVVVAPAGIPAPTGHDRTSIVCFQDADRPGNLHGILGQFAARNINLTKLESRPTKKGLGDYCFIIDMEGHIEDEVVADCLRDLHAQMARLKFLGSYPAAGDHGPALRQEAARSWREADEWIGSLRAQVLG
ncbi:MAG: prephenate dehydratase [Acidimicrobiales bacterium]